MKDNVLADQGQRPCTVRCRQCPWASEAPNMDSAMDLFEAHTKAGHQDNPYHCAASFQVAPETPRWYRCLHCGRQHLSVLSQSMNCQTCLP